MPAHFQRAAQPAVIALTRAFGAARAGAWHPSKVELAAGDKVPEALRSLGGQGAFALEDGVVA